MTETTRTYTEMDDDVTLVDEDGEPVDPDDLGHCQECGEPARRTDTVCPHCDFNAPKHHKKQMAYFGVFCGIVSTFFPPAAIVLVPLAVVGFIAAWMHDWTVTEEDPDEQE